MKLRYSLRTLLVVMFLVGPLCVFVWPKYVAWREEQARLKQLTLQQQRKQSIAELTWKIGQLGGGTRVVSEDERQRRKLEAQQSAEADARFAGAPIHD